MARTGRRPGNQDTREAILAAARDAFAERGFDRTSIRAIATSAGVERELLATRILRRALSSLPIDPAEVPMRGALIASQMAGLAMMRYLLKLEPLASADHKTVVAAVAPNIRRYLREPLPLPE